jgi:predicted nucleotidyltransferase
LLQATGIIVEYNPFHNGHAYHVQQARQLTQADVVVAVMSGNFVQRGAPALLDKWQRTAQALANGVDLVIELPTTQAVQPADRFANAGIQTLATLGCQAVVFGTEDAQIDYQQVGQQLRQLPEHHQDFKDYQQTYATQLNQFYQQQLGLSLDHPNQLLGLSYAQANAGLVHPMTLVPIQRQGSQYHDTQLTKGLIGSATAIRQALQQVPPQWNQVQQVVPDLTFKTLQQGPMVHWAMLFPFLKYRILQADLSDLQAIYQMSEGLEYRMKQQIQAAATFEAFLKALKTKRYTYSRLQRLCLYTVLNLKTTAIQAQQPYLHVLGFTPAGQHYLHQIKQQVPWPLITKIDRKLGQETGLMGTDVRTDLVYQNLTGVNQVYGRYPLRPVKEI